MVQSEHLLGITWQSVSTRRWSGAWFRRTKRRLASASNFSKNRQKWALSFVLTNRVAEQCSRLLEKQFNKWHFASQIRVYRLLHTNAILLAMRPSIRHRVLWIIRRIQIENQISIPFPLITFLLVWLENWRAPCLFEEHYLSLQLILQKKMCRNCVIGRRKSKISPERTQTGTSSWKIKSVLSTATGSCANHRQDWSGLDLNANLIN